MEFSSSFNLPRGGWAVALVALAFAGYSRAESAAAPATPKAVVVEAADVVTRTVPLVVDSVGNADAAATVVIRPLVNSRIEEVLVADGAEVKAGQPLLRFDRRAYGAQLARMKAERDARAAQVQALQARLERSADLIKGDFVSAQQAQEQSVELAQAKAALAAAEAGVQQATIDFENCEPKAPFDGRIGLFKTPASVGNFATAGSDPLLEVRALDQLRLEFSVPESVLAILTRAAEQGSPLKVVATQHGDSAHRLEGAVVAFDNVIDPRSRSLKVRALAPNPDRQFWPGEFLDIQLIVGTAPDALLVPEQAVNTGPKGPYLYVIEGGKARMKLVDVGQAVGDLVLIKSGVGSGQKVIVSGQLGLQDGSSVQVSTASGV